jgi:hypothetical protein
MVHPVSIPWNRKTTGVVLPNRAVRTFQTAPRWTGEVDCGQYNSGKSSASAYSDIFCRFGGLRGDRVFKLDFCYQGMLQGQELRPALYN